MDAQARELRFTIESEVHFSKTPTGALERAFLHPAAIYRRATYTLDGTGADGPRPEGGRRVLLDNSRVYVRFLPFVSGRVHLARISDSPSSFRYSVRASDSSTSRPRLRRKAGQNLNLRVSATPPPDGP